ncbi:ATP-binding response regulator [Halodesulfovibrio spirochaetisodalis]|uniref:histidine kinase n=1 Tax=Halodesulfovibrio spirochaetisodalis TaxID=1560234 RepID=A0A1B7X9T9_9BACT|nr:hybrid sensor histidine kinase/response regulator [Halodesulfovibrio spirochaetisodalis]OBQ46107.1 histidine kinase [Halodesulfovibrio spirochaetisodalis]
MSIASRSSVLLVDDEKGITVVLGAYITDLGYVIDVAHSGEEALEKLQQKAYEVVVTDVRMPGMDGVALLKEIRKHWPETGVVITTGHADVSVAVDCLRLGATDFITKPVNVELLEFALRRAVERVIMRRQLVEHTIHLEFLVEQRTKELVQAERFAVMGETVAGLAHAIKNIAGGLEGALFVLEKGLELDRKDYLEQGWGMVKRDVTRVRDLTMNLLQLSRPLSLRPSKLDPGLPLSEVAELLSARMRDAGGKIIHENMPQPVALLDEQAVHTCLMNLATNAVEAVEEAVQSGRREFGDGKVMLHTECDEQYVRYLVEDNGRGLSSELFEQLEEGLVTTKDRGSGFGLMATRKAVREMGGELILENGIEGGVRAILLLPFVPVGNL